MRGIRLHVADSARERAAQAIAITALLMGTASLASPSTQPVKLTSAPSAVQAIAATIDWPAAPAPERLVWGGADIDGDGAADFANPTGKDTRGHDAYGYGEFGASRDGGSRQHEGVDFVAEAGQQVVAPISGYVTKIGYAYGGDNDLKFVEITNPALKYAARVFYVSPSVDVGDTVHVGLPIGKMHTLQEKYRGGMTDHVHLEILKRGRRIDATDVITAKLVRGGDARG
ncbi:M23 family metallopeptidase [Phenylobacterium sp.]|jgi:murein DD-endopeptidase MepM/ murein hydrolase activator NlpD|uniref:M23 family metallopeptidase n=1 Tax=Phenylobacterium sp. TaxID=1871053 RepID=UPI002F95F4BE